MPSHPGAPRVGLLATTFEREGYDFMRNGTRAWFEAWGSGSKAGWTRRVTNGRPPTPDELMHAEFIVVGFDGPRGVYYRTMTGGLDVKRK